MSLVKYLLGSTCSGSQFQGFIGNLRLRVCVVRSSVASVYGKSSVERVCVTGSQLHIMPMVITMKLLHNCVLSDSYLYL